MADLPTNYLDDILAQSMNGKRKFRITRPDGTFEDVIIEDISEYSQTGSTFGAGDINRTNQAVNEKFDSEDVVDPMLTTEPGFAADAYKTKLQFDELNKNIIRKSIAVTLKANTTRGVLEFFNNEIPIGYIMISALITTAATPAAVHVQVANHYSSDDSIVVVYDCASTADVSANITFTFLKI